MSTDTDRISLDGFIAQHGITATIERGGYALAHRPSGDWAHSAWTVTIESEAGAYLVVPFFTGSAASEPTVNDVLECLALDAAGYENARNFRGWADEYGYDVDDDEFGQHERTFRAVETQTENLRAQLGHDAFEQLVWNVDTA